MIILHGNGQVSVRSIGASITGEKTPGDLDNWDTFSTDINDAVHYSYGDLQERSSTLFHTYGPVISAINKTTNMAIGSGNIFRSDPNYRILGITPKQAKEWGRTFQALVHNVFLMLNWYEKQPVVFKQALAVGDCLVHFIRDNQYSFDLVEESGDKIIWEKSDEKNWRLGIQHDRYARRVALYTNRRIPYQNPKTGDQNVVQFMIKDLARQLRGLPLAYKIIALAKSHDRFIDATVQRAVIESLLLGYSNTNTTEIDAQLENMQKQAQGMKVDRGLGYNKVFRKFGSTKDLTPGGLLALRTGESMQFTDLKTPSNTFDPFNQWMVRFVAMATDTTPGVIMSQYSTSYSSSRSEHNDFYSMALVKRRTFNTYVNKVMVREVAKMLILNGVIKAPGFFDNKLTQEAWLSGHFLGPVPRAINPLVEVKADVLAIQNALKTRGDAAINHASGGDFHNFLEDWGDQEKAFQKLQTTNPDQAGEAVQGAIQNA